MDLAPQQSFFSTGTYYYPTTWRSKDGFTRIWLDMVDGYRLYPAGESGSSSSHRRLEVYLRGAPIPVSVSEDIDSLLSQLDIRLDAGGCRPLTR